MKHIILASASPRRREILSALDVSFTVRVSDVDEQSDVTDPALFAETLAHRKGLAVWHSLPAEEQTDGTAVLSADTVVVCDGEILGKPTDEADATRMLSRLRGREHHVITGVCVTVGGRAHTAHSDTVVRVADIPDAAIARYVASGDPMDKAGAYGIQGAFSRWVEGIDGCYFGVVGLPIHVLAELYLRVTGEELYS
jgi:septum formation protein